MSDMLGAKIRCRGIIHHNDEVMVITQGPVTCLPGGTMESGETPLQTVTRELEEELGIAPVIGDVRAILSYDIEGKHPRVEFVYEVKNGSDYYGRDERGAATHGFELDQIDRRPIDDLGDDFLPGELVDVAALLTSDGVRYVEVRV